MPSGIITTRTRRNKEFEMDFKEFRAKTVEDAEIDAARAFGVVTADLEVEVVEKGSAGFLGLGAKQAVIRVRVKETAGGESSAAETPVAAEKKAEPKVTKTISTEAPVDTGDLIADTKAYLDRLFAAMELEATVEVKMEEEEDVLAIDVEGPDMGVLIGKRGQTLDALQYLISLYVNKKSKDKYIRVKLDTENYRARRKETLENLAKNIAFKVKRSRRSFTLEPMNPYERRIIHSTLQNDKFVATRSEGEEPYRKVVVYLKKKDNYNQGSRYEAESAE